MPGQPWLSFPGRCVKANELNGKGPKSLSSDRIVSAARVASCALPATGFSATSPPVIGPFTSGGIGEGEVDVVVAPTMAAGFGITFSTPRVAYESTSTSPALAVLRT